jgi:hypothetical protein
MLDRNQKIYGWFGSASQTEPAYNPPFDAACLICGASLKPDDVRTISLMWQSGAKSALFYRVHSSCHNALSREQQDVLDGEILDLADGDA